MAELPEKDKRILFGDNYKEVLAKAQEEGLVQSNSQAIVVAQIEKCRNNKFSAIALMIVGALLFVSNFYAVSGPSVLAVGIAGIVIFLLGLVWYVRILQSLRNLGAKLEPANIRAAA